MCFFVEIFSKKLVDTLLDDGYNSIKHINLIKIQGIKNEGGGAGGGKKRPGPRASF